MKKIRNSKKFIYLISPPKIDIKNFFDQLEDVFKTKKISFFQLRLKKTPKKKILYIGKKVVRLCKKFNVKYDINFGIKEIIQYLRQNKKINYKNMGNYKVIND